ncbi:MAG: glycosyltransferase family 4 protein [Nitrospiraceae bacterium]
MRVCFFNRSYYPDLGATGQFLTELAEDLVDKGCEVSVVAGVPVVSGDPTWTPPARMSPVTWERRHGVSIFRARGTSLWPGVLLSKYTNYLTYFGAAAIAGLRLPQADVVVALTDPPIIGLIALAVARRQGSKFVLLCEDIYPEAGRLTAGVESRAINGALDRVSRLLVRNADHIIALGETMRKRLVEGKGANPGKVAVIHNWVDCDLIVPGPKQNQFSLTHGLADKFVVMHSGNIGLSQELEAVVQAAARLKRFPDIEVVFVGEGVKKPVLEEQVRALGLQNVRFLPYQPKDNLRDSFATAEVFIVSLKRGLAGYIVPSKLYGILAAGRPYVAAVEEMCEVTTITKKYNCGLLAEPGDPGDLAQKILTLYHDSALSQRLGANARQAAVVFDRKVQVRAYNDLFHELVHARPAAA